MTRKNENVAITVPLGKVSHWTGRGKSVAAHVPIGKVSHWYDWKESGDRTLDLSLWRETS